MKNPLLSEKATENFSFLRGNNLLELLELIENEYIKYRKSLYLPSNITFGVEIEYEEAERNKVTSYIKKYASTWNSGRDGSLRSGGEIRSPILIDERATWLELKKICEYLKKENANTSKRAGAHIHVGTPVLGNNLEGWRIFLKIVMLYEHIFYRFYYGDKLNGRQNIREYAPPISEELFECLDKINRATTVEELKYYVPEKRYSSINFNNVKFYRPKSIENKNTIELRCPNGTDEEIIWQNNINTFSKMLLSSGAKVIDEAFLDYKLKKFEPNSDSSLRYNEIFLKDALEFVDLIFNCNLDKVYFLRQYLKGFQVGVDANVSIPAKRFIA